MKPEDIAKKKMEAKERIDEFIENRTDRSDLKETITSLVAVINETNDHQCRTAYHLLRSGNFLLASAALKNLTSEKTGKPIKD